MSGELPLAASYAGRVGRVCLLDFPLQDAAQQSLTQPFVVFAAPQADPLEPLDPLDQPAMPPPLTPHVSLVTSPDAPASVADSILRDLRSADAEAVRAAVEDANSASREALTGSSARTRARRRSRGAGSQSSQRRGSFFGLYPASGPDAASPPPAPAAPARKTTPKSSAKKKKQKKKKVVVKKKRRPLGAVGEGEVVSSLRGGSQAHSRVHHHEAHVPQRQVTPTHEATFDYDPETLEHVLEDVGTRAHCPTQHIHDPLASYKNVKSKVDQKPGRAQKRVVRDAKRLQRRPSRTPPPAPVPVPAVGEGEVVSSLRGGSQAHSRVHHHEAHVPQRQVTPTHEATFDYDPETLEHVLEDVGTRAHCPTQHIHDPLPSYKNVKSRVDQKPGRAQKRVVRDAKRLRRRSASASPRSPARRSVRKPAPAPAPTEGEVVSSLRGGSQAHSRVHHHEAHVPQRPPSPSREATFDYDPATLEHVLEDVGTRAHCPTQHIHDPLPSYKHVKSKVDQKPGRAQKRVVRDVKRLQRRSASASPPPAERRSLSPAPDVVLSLRGGSKAHTRIRHPHEGHVAERAPSPTREARFEYDPETLQRVLEDVGTRAHCPTQHIHDPLPSYAHVQSKVADH